PGGLAASPGRDDQPLQRDRHGPADRSRDQELDPLGRVHEPIEGARHGDARCGDRGGAHPAAPDSHDVGGDDHGRNPGDDRTRRGFHLAPAARLRDRGRHLLFHGAHIVRRARGVRAAEPPDGARAEPRPCGTTRGGRLLLARVAAPGTARYDLFTGGQEFAELSRSAAALDGAHAGELVARFASALLTESDYYAVLANAELLRVARERAQRAEQQLAVARARVAS